LLPILSAATPHVKPLEDALENPFLAERDDEVITQYVSKRSILLLTYLFVRPEYNGDGKNHIDSHAEAQEALPSNSDDEVKGDMVAGRTISSDDENDSDTRARKRRKIYHTTEPDSSATSTLAKKASGSSFPSITASSNTSTSSYIYALNPPTTADLEATIGLYDIPSKIYKAPYYSLESDAPTRPREYAGLVFDLKGGTGIANLEDWVNQSDNDSDVPCGRGTLDVYGWEYASLPPSRGQTRKWLSKNTADREEELKNSSQVLSSSKQCDSMLTPANTDCWAHPGKRCEVESNDPDSNNS
jgi:hypothetical protein